MKYKTIVIDPPWDVKSGIKQNKKYYSKLNNDLPYQRMNDEEIIQFPINDYADENCNLFLWVTHTKLPFALELIKLWGFKYHCLITWNKGNGLSMFGFRRMTEFVIYCYKGKMGINKKGDYIPTLVDEKRTVHSRKPNKFYKILLHTTPEPRIDIFARKRHIGFDAFGDQVESSLQTTLTQEGSI